MDSANAALPDLDRMSVAELKLLLRDQHAEIRFYKTEIGILKLQIIKLRRILRVPLFFMPPCGTFQPFQGLAVP